MPELKTSWEVVNQVPTSGQGPDARYGPGMLVSIKTGAGHRGQLFVPQDQYSPDKVRPLLAALAQRLDQIGQLSG